MARIRDWSVFTAVGTFKFKLQQYYSNLKTEGDCWLWQGGRHRQGYGMVPRYDTVKQKFGMMTTHRAAMMIHLDRDLKPGEVVMHKCNNYLCCNPDHLKLGVVEEVRDNAVARGVDMTVRAKDGTKKELNRRYKYSEEEIQFVRSAPSEQIAQRYNKTLVEASRMRYNFRHAYRWLPLPEDK